MWGIAADHSAKRLWAKIPLAYRQHATFYTDQYVGFFARMVKIFIWPA